MATSLTPEEVREFLKTQRTLIPSTLEKDGAPVSHASAIPRVRPASAARRAARTPLEEVRV